MPFRMMNKVGDQNGDISLDIEKSSGNDKISTAYDYFMIVVIVVSLIPLAFKDESKKGIDEKEDDTSE